MTCLGPLGGKMSPALVTVNQTAPLVGRVSSCVRHGRQLSRDTLSCKSSIPSRETFQSLGTRAFPFLYYRYSSVKVCFQGIANSPARDEALGAKHAASERDLLNKRQVQYGLAIVLRH